MERAVASHYNARPDVGTEQRKSSRIFHLKNFNNWVKAVLISRHVRRDDYVLDLCCGKGGDLLKWKTGRIKYLFAADIAEFSVDQAKTRYQSGNFPFNADFIACDCFSDDLLKHTRRQTFDIVNIQFALHYAFETEERATTAIRNIAKHLVSGGHFIGTIPNSNWIVKKLRDAPGLTFGNEIYSITFDQKDTWPIFGHQYRFALADAIDDCPEYLIHFPTLIKYIL